MRFPIGMPGPVDLSRPDSGTLARRILVHDHYDNALLQSWLGQLRSLQRSDYSRATNDDH
jgi:hypothetical protein